MTKPINMMRVKNRPGLLIPKPPLPFFRPREQRFYNWAGRDENGKPIAEDKSWEVPRDEYHMRMVMRKDLSLDDRPKADPAPKPKKAKTEDK